MDDLENIGGEAGGNDLEAVPKLLLKRSELLTLRKMADRYPVTEGERQEVVDVTMDLIRNAKSRRLRLSAVKAMTGLERLNLTELQMYLQAIGKGEQHTPEVNVNNNIVLQVVETIVEKDP